MHTRSKSARPRTRAVIVTLLIALGVVASVGVGQAAESAGPNDGAHRAAVVRTCLLYTSDAADE